MLGEARNTSGLAFGLGLTEVSRRLDPRTGVATVAVAVAVAIVSDRERLSKPLMRATGDGVTLTTAALGGGRNVDARLDQHSGCSAVRGSDVSASVHIFVVVQVLVCLVRYHSCCC